MRVLFDVLVLLVALFLAGYFWVQWISHGYPLYGRDGLLGGRATILPWLWVSIVMLVVAGVAALDCYLHSRS